MKYTPIAVAVIVMLLRFSFILAQTSDCQKKCDAVFIACSGKCAKSSDATCGATCIRDKDACVKNCALVQPKPAPINNEKKSNTEKKVDPKDDDDADIDDDTDSDDDTDMEDGDEDTDVEDDTDDTGDDSDAPDMDEEGL
jgi:hypothetical protein